MEHYFNIQLTIARRNTEQRTNGEMESVLDHTTNGVSPVQSYNTCLSDNDNTLTNFDENVI